MTKIYPFFCFLLEIKVALGDFGLMLKVFVTHC